MMRWIEIPSAPVPFGPVERLPIEVGMLPEPGLHPFAIEKALEKLMGDAERAGRVFHVVAAEPSGAYDIVHYAGDLSSSPKLPGGRLIILQIPTAAVERARNLAMHLASFGPAVLAIGSEDASLLHDALVAVYAGIVHNRSLDEIVESDVPHGAIEVLLVGSAEANRSLALKPLLDRYVDLGRTVAARVKETVDRAAEIGGRLTRLLHESQRGPFETQLVRRLPAEPSDLSSRVDALVSNINWAHESGGAVPLSAALEELPHAEHAERSTRAVLDEVDRQVSEEAARAPRVMNANFATKQGVFLPASEPLLSGAEYELLVDVGPAWDTKRTIVVGAAQFPTHALPPTKEGGWNVDLTFISEDFVPHTAAARMFVPQSGRSWPILADGKRAKKSGPVSISVRATSTTKLHMARGRLSLYFEGTVIQSAAVAVNVAARSDAKVDEPNRIAVDYVLSGPLSELSDTFGSRDVGLSLVMNDDGGAGHRFILRGADDPLPAFIPYDPTGATKQLEESRDALLALFYAKDNEAKPTKKSGLAKDNGKDLDQFKLDLYVLARIGNRLRAGALPEARPQEGGPSAPWRRSLAKSLLSKRIIHIARTHSSSYVFPWALVYQHALEGDAQQWRYCKVIEEEWPNGRRTGPPSDRCPHNARPDDHRNRLCPYGFWGLKHVVEQPVSLAVTENGEYDPNRVVATKIARQGGKLHVAVGMTTDQNLDARLIGPHLKALGTLPSVEVESPEAVDTTQMLDVLQSPQIVYLLCHGMYDEEEDSPYLGIGPVDRLREHRIYPSMLDDWATREESPSLAAWTTIRPLVFINGCATADVTPDQMLSFVSAFSDVPAGGIVGTEVSVQLPVAAEFAEAFFTYLLRNEQADTGEAMRQARWQLANKGNLLGLAYTMYCMANLQFV